MENVQRLVITLVMLSVVASCVVIVPKNSTLQAWMPLTESRQAQHMARENKRCPVFTLPKLGEIPKTPQITEEEMKSKDLVFDKLIENIRILRDTVEDDRAKLRKAYEDYIKRCRGKK